MPNRRLVFFAVIAALILAVPVLRAEDTLAVSGTPVEDRFDFADGLYARSMYEMAAAEYKSLLHDAPGHPRAQDAAFRLAESFFFMDRFEEALTHYRNWLTRYPSQPQTETAHLRMGDCLYRLGRREEALAEFTAAGQSTKALIQNAAHYYLGKISLEKKDYTAAAQYLEPLQEPSPENTFNEIATYYLGQIALKQGDTEKSRPLFQKLKDSAKEDLRELSRLGLAQTAYEQEKFEEAYTLFQALTNDAARTEVRQEAFLYSLKTLYELKRYPEILAQQKIWTATGKAQTDFPILMLSASSLLQMKRAAEAVPVYDTALALPGLSPRDRESAELGKLEALLQSGDPAKALETARALPQQREFFMDRWLYLIAEIQKQSGNTAEALTLLKTLSEKTEDKDYVSRALLTRAHLLIDQGKFEEARDLFDRFLHEFPDHPLTRQTLANRITLDIKLNQFDQATQSSLAFLERFGNSPEAAEVHFQLGSLYLKLEKYEDAFHTLEEHLARYPNDGKRQEALFFMAYTRQLSGDLEKAEALYRKVEKSGLPSGLYITGLKNLAYCQVRLDRLEEAAETYHRMIAEAPPEDFKADLFLWLAAYDHNKKGGEALLQDVEAFKASPDAAGQTEALDYYRAEAQRLLGNEEAALPSYESVISRPGPWKVRAMLGKSRVLSGQENFEAALAVLEQALQEAREAPAEALAVRLETAAIYDRREMPAEAAKGYLAIAILYDAPDTVPDALMKAGAAFEKAGQSIEAAKAYDELLQRFPDHPLAASAKAKLKRAS